MDRVETGAAEGLGERSVPRRGILVGVLAGLAALLGKASPAQAQSLSTPTFTLGGRNLAANTTELELVGRGDVPAFKASAGAGASVGALGNANANTSRFPVNTGAPNTGGMPLNLAAVSGESRGQIGVFGNSDTGVGVWGASESNIATWGVSNTGVGVLGQTHPDATAGPAQTYPPSGVYGVSGTKVGVWGRSSSNVGTWGQSDSGIGVLGGSGNIGAWFRKGNVDIDPATLEPAALHTTALGTDVSGCFRAQAGVAVMAEAQPAGVALMTMGRIQSDMIGAAKISRHQEVVEIQCGAVNERSHVGITLSSDIDARPLFVELLPGKGFRLHLDRKAKRDGMFTYAISEAMPAGQHR